MGGAEPRDDRLWRDGWWRSRDGIRLHYRDYPGASDRLPILCVPGLTRNARDFAAVAERLAGTRRVIAVDLRGRGQSGQAPDPLSYVPPVYVDDVLTLLAELGLPRVVWFGTSLGGIMAMLAALAARPVLAGVLLNDVGPVLEPVGLARIGSYVGKSASWPTWLHAARSIEETHAAFFPHWQLEDWLAMAHRTCRLTEQGRIVFDYDGRIAEPFRLPPPDPPVDLWPGLLALAGSPALLVRGGLSDLLSAATAERMAAILPDLELVTVPDVGHAPTLDEAEAVAGIDRLLQRINA
ncbi:alpha/beta fold hydrolase [Sphingomonas nostoxanthinifaciens]|uniref:alpha/beta fold hydrolase n=1 Tax=Sphingomonas nostoxanthinifaciens TaxID=2872652 RepID=UPI001CC1DEB2|nr:alpha/beta hydrolase [Sphingomonas nostoxanthinifaciens]UAK26196.1 alpha/beta hydrolase [Sphingomonas nostoxanthinifaciens]